ncbi:hypothetical protein HETIRDRAFT_481608 [Heterobasidion irregulare TC 32-1]|uniref:MYND-type domain-containing protein n=1 Tax=Heterobasidion irregulare (strain TC 32-1) TaxID=747525 RepID=W4JT81_HETIT|nr:uncharacterized protein HETIRDRAFT_481608 [Heterobasidion irregulare TC 32-1]ETW76096.1 hypothetical protein HETIRDRAFT_481608 [Heterobasidion irregulare TC 32-1]
MASSQSTPPKECAACSKDASDQLLTCPRCQNESISYCSQECQEADSQHSWDCRLPVVQGIQILCDGERHDPPFNPVEITPTHQIYEYGDVCPVSEVIDLPIVMFRHSTEHPLNM